MKKENGLDMRKICMLAGLCLLAVAIVTLAAWRWSIHTWENRAEGYVQTLCTLIPASRDAVPEARRDNTMSALSVEGIDFVGIVEFPGYGSVLPVAADWGKSTRYPCRFGGSIYDGTLQVGATTQRGQYDFYRELSVGDTVFYTDMEGNRYRFEVSGLRYEKHVDQASLQRQDAALTLFIKNIYSFEYLMVFCNVSYG